MVKDTTNYTLIWGYNQNALVKYKLKLSDARILSYLAQYFNSGNAKHINVGTKTYYMIYYNKILVDNEVLQINYDSLRKKIRNLEELGFIEKYKNDINSTTLYLRVLDDRLRTSEYHKKMSGNDELLATFIKANWRVKRNWSCEINIFNNRFDYQHTYIKSSVLNYLNGEYFNLKLRENLESALPNFIKHISVEVINNIVRLSTKNSMYFYDYFVENSDTIERAICFSYIETLKQM